MEVADLLFRKNEVVILSGENILALFFPHFCLHIEKKTPKKLIENVSTHVWRLQDS